MKSKLKRAVSLIFAAALLLCCFAGCGEDEDKSNMQGVGKENIVVCDLLGLSDAELREKLGEPFLVENIESEECLEFTDYCCWVSFGLGIRDINSIPFSYRVQRVFFGTKAPEVIAGLKAGMTYSQIHAMPLFADLEAPGESETSSGGDKTLTARTDLTFEYNDILYHINFIFGSEDRVLLSGMIEIVDEDSTAPQGESSTGENELSSTNIESTTEKSKIVNS